MCGLSGLAGTIEQKHDAVFRDLLYFNGVRGDDSTGVAGIYREWSKFEPNWQKTLGGPWELLSDKKFDKFMKYYYCVLFGHNRSATVGVSSIKNAHPFIHSGPYSKCILGMHNGTLEGMTKYDMKDDAQFGTDSEAIINNLAFEGPQKTIPKLEGAWALVWYDKDKHTLSMIRNDKRPLFFVLSEDEKVLFWGSEIPMLKAALDRHNMKYGEFYKLAEDVLYTWKVPDQEKQFESPTETALKGKEKFHLASSQSNMHYIDKDGNKIPFTMGPTTGNKLTAEQVRSKFVATKVNPTQTSGTTSSTTVTSSSGQKSTYKGLCSIDPYKGLKDFGVHGGTHVLFDPKADNWIQTKYDVLSKEFDPNLTSVTRWAPPYLPYSQLDVNGNHIFKHVGKKKKKHIFMKGWNDELLSQEMVEHFLSFGCSGCGRHPQWGNYVYWFDKDHDFLCEFCAESETQKHNWRAA